MNDHHFTPTLESKAFARLILAAMSAREGSYDKAAADAATIRNATYRAENPDQPEWLYVVDYSEFYKLTMLQACEQTAGVMGYPLYLMLQYAWNDAEVWALEQLK